MNRRLRHGKGVGVLRGNFLRLWPSTNHVSTGLLLKNLNKVTIMGIYKDNGKENGNYYNAVI